MAFVKEALSMASIQCLSFQSERLNNRRAAARKTDLNVSLAVQARQNLKRGNAAVRVAAEGVSSTTSENSTVVKDIDVLIETEAGVSYDELRSKLSQGLWEEADKETRRLICELAGEAAAKRKWVYFTEARALPGMDLLTIDRLWRAYSDDKFGYSVQRRLWKVLSYQWRPFFLKIGWTAGPNSIYKKFPMEFTWDIEAPVGHLPLTNALRGTQLLQSILTHPAFEVFDAEESMPGDADVPTFSDDESAVEAASPAKRTVAVGFDESFNSADYGF